MRIIMQSSFIQWQIWIPGGYALLEKRRKLKQQRKLQCYHIFLTEKFVITDALVWGSLPTNLVINTSSRLLEFFLSTVPFLTWQITKSNNNIKCWNNIHCHKCTICCLIIFYYFELINLDLKGIIITHHRTIKN